MKLQITPISEANLEEVALFLRRTFSVDPAWVPFRTDVLRWKALEPHPLWEGSRGYALCRDGELVAYGCAMPTRFVQQDGETLVACVVDWAASKAMPGGGVAIYQHIAKFTQGMIGVGGTDDAQRVITRMGFSARQHFEVGERVTRPLQRFLGAKEKSVRELARFGRNVYRGLKPLGSPAAEWSARRVVQFDETVEAVLPRPGVVSDIVCFRNAAMLNYLLHCPAAQMEGYLIERAGRVAGYFLLAFTRDECRIADLWVASNEESAWLAGLQLAARGREGNQVSLAYGTDFARRVAKSAGLHLIVRQPIYVKDPKSTLPATMNTAVGLSEMDAFFL